MFVVENIKDYRNQTLNSLPYYEEEKILSLSSKEFNNNSKLFKPLQSFQNNHDEIKENTEESSSLSFVSPEMIDLEIL